MKGNEWRLLFLFPLLIALITCATENAAKKDTFFEKWSTTAKESGGHSPAPRSRVVILPEAAPPEKKAEETPKEIKVEEIIKPLPDVRVTLKMRQADIKAVIRALAKAAGVNIIVKNDIKGDISVDFSGVPWGQAFESILHAHGLSYMWEGDIIRVLTLEDMELALKVAAVKEKKKAQELEVKRIEPLLTMVVNVDYADAESLKENLQEFLTKDKDGKIARGSVRVDKHSNSLIIQAIRDDLARMIPLIEKIDRPTPQVNIKANIVEASKEVARNLGIQWGGVYGRQIGGQGLYITPGGTGGLATNPAGPFSGNYNPTSGVAGVSGQGFGVNFPAQVPGVAQTGQVTASASLGLMFGTIGSNILELQLQALQKDNKINILSSPSITTLDNQKAFTENGERIPYVSTALGAGGATTQEVKWEDAVLRLEITPHVIDGKNLKMKILVKKDEVDTSRQVAGNPFIIKKQTETTLICQDGETIVISGLSKQRNTNTESGVPWLKDVPVLGWLFKGEQKADQMQEVLIFITPTILPPQVAKAEELKKP